jgi:hypothetical protein
MDISAFLFFFEKRMENSNRTLHAYAREGRVKGIQRLLKQGKRL